MTPPEFLGSQHGSATTTDGGARGGRGVGWRWVIVTLLIAAVVGGALLVGRASAQTATPSDASPEAGFARDMQAHHAQAVEMSLLIRDRTEDPEVRSLAYDIALTQQHQIGQMYAWLVEWGLPQTGPGPAMARMETLTDEETMGHDMSGDGQGDSPMPGMASAQNMRDLGELSGESAERLFLRLMIEHHRGGITMAQAVLTGTDHPDVRLLAQTMVTGQTAEITAMQAMLAERQDDW